jgi:uncharacterized membrane protein
MTLFSWKFVHLLGVVLLVGNVTVTAVWKVFADRSGRDDVIRFAQRLVTITDWSLTVPGVLLTIVGGVGTALSMGIPVFQGGWLRLSELLFTMSGIIWLAILVPIQIRQARETREDGFSFQGSSRYRSDARRWLGWGVLATALLVAAMWLMIAKPGVSLPM